MAKPGLSWLILVAALGLTPACTSEESEGKSSPLPGSDASPDDGGGPPVARPARALSGDCDPLVPGVCLFPFPSDVYLKADSSAPGGRRVVFPEGRLPGATQTAPWTRCDGFSAGVAPMTFMPGATTAGLPTPLDIARSLDADSPTVLIDATTGERIPHFSELDMSHDDDSRRAFMLRPTRRLADDTRYIVAIRNVVDAAGTPLSASPGFAALRDDKPSDDPDVEGGRALYEHLFGVLGRAGVERGSLQLAWDFTTATRENNTRAMLHMRDEALAEVGTKGPRFENLTILDDVDADTARRIDGEMVVPLYLDTPAAGGVMSLDDQGLPARNGEARYPFVVFIPHSAKGSPKPPLAIGHGLLGSRDQAAGFATFANQFGYVLFAVDWIGMAGDDVANIAGMLGAAEMHRFQSVADRLQQGFLNFLLASRLMTGDFASDAATQLEGGPTIDTTTPYYYGGSQGGIFGASVMAISTDFPRGVLGVPGQPYGLLLNRSVDFDLYLGIARSALPDHLDIQFLIALAQMLWDRAEPSGYSPYVRQNLLPGTPAHEVLMIAALGDHQVNTLGAHIMARSIGAKMIRPTVRDVFELEAVAPPHRGSGFVEMDFGNPADPITNTPPRAGQDPHGRPAEVPAAAQLVDHFLKTGEVSHFCDGPCDPG